jgi:hypothetical protein
VWLAVVRVEQIGGGIVWARPDSAPYPGGVAVLGADAGRYRLIPVVRDLLSADLPRNLRGMAVSRTLQDLLAIIHPTAPLAAAALYQAAGLDVIAPTLVLLADDSLLPESLLPLAGQPVWLEPDPAALGLPFGRFHRVLTSEALFALLKRQPDIAVDLPRFLAARLLDLLIGDRNRGPAHWLWGEESEGGSSRWVPIAVHQEEAFLRADGWSRLLLSRHAPGYGVFGPSPPDVAALAATADDLDRPLLARLERATWDSVAGALAERLTTEAVSAAVARLPPAHQARSGPLLTAALLARRERLGQVAARFYRLLTRYADIELTDTGEEVRLNRDSTGDVVLRVNAAGRETLGRRFRATETEELRLHLGGGDDHVTLTGVEHGGVGVRLTSTNGTVSLIREGPTTRRIVLYARPAQARLSPPHAVRLVPEPIGRWRRWQPAGGPPAHLDWGVRRSPVVALGLGGDIGVSGTLGVQWMLYGFGQPHYRQVIRATFSYASLPDDIAVGAGFERRDVLHDLHLSAGFRYTGIDVARYYGLGNETRRPRDLARSRATVRELSLGAAVGISSRPELELRVGPVLTLGGTDTTTTGRLVTRDRPYGSGRFDAAGLAASFRYTPERAEYAPGFGVLLEADASAFPGWLDVRRGAFGRVGGTVELSWLPVPASRLLLRSRLGGSLLAGVVPFRNSARIGGPQTLRGYDLDRFAGDRAAAYGAIELLTRVARVRIGFLSADLGLLGFGDAGRVWTRGEHSSTIHSALGTGLWASPAMGWLPNLDHLVLRVEAARGSEGIRLWIATGSRF